MIDRSPDAGSSAGPHSAATPTFDRVWQIYRRRVACCRTENQSNRLHIVIENYMTPAEVHHFDQALEKERHDAPGRMWIAQLLGQMPTRKSRTVEFERHGIRRDFTLYTASTVPASQKTLIIGFAGNYHRLMAPTPYLLDCLNPAKYDLLVLRDLERRLFSKGFAGLGPDFFAAMQNLHRRVDPMAYRGAITLGTSGGALPALLAAVLLKLKRGVALGSPDFQRFQGHLHERGVDDARYAELFAARPEPFPDLILAYGAAFGKDATAAHALHGLIPSHLHPVENCATHSLFGWHLRRRTMPAFLEALLGQDLETGEPLPPLARRSS